MFVDRGRAEIFGVKQNTKSAACTEQEVVGRQNETLGRIML